jgi:signal peptidase I
MQTEPTLRPAAPEPSRLVSSLPLLLPGPVASNVSFSPPAVPVQDAQTLEAEGVGRAESAPPAWVDSMARTVAMVRDGVAIAVPAILLALVVHLFLAQATIVYGQSMEPNLSPYQRLIVEKASYRVRAPQRNEIVVVDLPGLDDMLVKRVVGLPGETIAVRQGLVYVNGAPLMEPFPHDLDNATMAPVTLGPTEIFVLGDNRDDSNDSRYFGPVEQQRILGRVWMRYWPLDRLRFF